jgi:hypothetical protein
MGLIFEFKRLDTAEDWEKDRKGALEYDRFLRSRAAYMIVLNALNHCDDGTSEGWDAMDILWDAQKELEECMRT